MYRLKEKTSLSERRDKGGNCYIYKEDEMVVQIHIKLYSPECQFTSIFTLE